MDFVSIQAGRPRSAAGWQRYQARQRMAGLGDNDFLASGGLID